MVHLSRTHAMCLAVAAMLALPGLSVSAQSNSNLRILPLGDSITAGYRSTTGDGYRQPLANELASQIGYLVYVGTQHDGTMSDPDNDGRFGARIDQIAAITNASLNSYKPNVVALLAGINDLGQNYQVSTAPSRLASLIDQILSAEPDATVLVSQLVVNSTARVESEVQTFNAALPAIVNSRASAGKHVYLVDMSALTTADLQDGLHPNDTGYQLMADAWDKAILAVIGKGWVHDPVAGSVARPTGTVFSGLAGKCVDGGSLAKGNAVAISTCTNGTSQQFNFNAGNIIVNNLCLDIVAGGTGNTSLVDLWSCNNQSNQVWTVQSNGTILNPASGRCLDDPNSSLVDGTQLEIYDCNTGANQQWLAPTQGAVTSGVAGKCLDDFAGSANNKNAVDLYSCNNYASQQWSVYNDTVKFDGKCLNVVNGGTSNKSLVDIEVCSGASAQKWTPINGTLVNGGSGRCLDDPGGSAVDGTRLEIYDCNNGNNQKWTLPNL